MYKNSKVAKNRTSTAVPAVAAPFVPASMPGSDLHWRKAAARKTKSGKLAKAVNTDKAGDRHIKNRTTEYEDKFVEWEHSERPEAHSDRQYAPTGFYERDMNAFDWKSEQQRTYTNKDAYPHDDKAAGVPRAFRSEVPPVFAWTMEGGRPDSDNEDRAQSRSGAAATGSPRRAVASEHVSKYSWPAMGERTQSAKPAATNKGSPLALDSVALMNSAHQWHSEYDAQCAELRRRQQELLQGTQSTAGVRSVKHGEIPAFYAWEEDEAPRHLEVRPQPALGGTRRTTSEYRTQFVEHPFQEREKPIIPEVPKQLNLFQEERPHASAYERGASVLHRDYPGHDVTALDHAARGNSPGRVRDDPNPKSFAWPLVDGGMVSDEDEAHQTLMRKNRVKNLVMPNSNCSEFTRNFACPPHEAYLHRAQPVKPTVGKALDLFAVDGITESKGETSEYNAAYKAPVGATTPERVTAATMKGTSELVYPTQFAWSLVNGGEKTLENPVRAKRPVLPNQDVSEYSRKFHWPAQTERSPPRRGDPAISKVAGESIIGLDAGDLAGGWQSEYDLQCAKLRQKQQDLLASGVPEHIAGVATKQRETIPTNYAWEMPPAPPVEASSQPAADHGAQPHSEYGDSFVQWPLAKREAIKPRPVAETLNLFREDVEASEEAKNGSDGDANASAAHSPVRPALQSEYNDKFHAFDGTTVTRPARGTGTKGLPLPPQFAWPRVDPPAPPSEHTAPAHDPSEPVFSEVSEYDSKFAWPPKGTHPATIVRPGTASGAVPMSTADSVIVPIPEKSTADSHWVSEYGAHAADAVHGSTEVTPAAGRATVVQAAIPHFYAWREKDLPPPAPKVDLPRYSCDQVRSEHDASFLAWPVLPHHEVAHSKSVPSTQNLLGDRSSGVAEEQKSEYNSKFTAHSAEEMKELANPYASQRSSAIEVPKPPQFAWPLVDVHPLLENKKGVDSPNAPHSEYATQFVWHGLADTAQGRRTARHSSAQGSQDELGAALALAQATRAVTANAPIALDESAMRASDWKSEYDDRCATLRQKQQEISAQSVRDPIAGVQTVPPENAPDFFAYTPKEEKKPVIPYVKHVEPELTEYAASYVTWPVRPDSPSHNRRGSESQYRDSFKSFQFGKDRHFRGVSEYDDQFRSNFAPPPAPAHQLAAAMDAKYNAPNLIAPPPAPEVQYVMPRAQPKNNRATGPKKSENAASYQWPDKSKLSGAAVPVLNSQRSNVVIGVNHPAARGKKASATAPLFITARGTRPATVPVKNSESADAFPESDFQSTSDSRESHSSDERKYTLMGQQIRDRKEGNTSRSDFTTGVLSATTSRAAPGAQQFHISQQFGDRPATMGTTGSVSVDSLAAGAPSRLASGGNIQGLRFPEQTSHQVFRARSAPHRQRLAVSYDHDGRSPIKTRTALDDTDSNPVLMHKRYPYVSKKQLGRWTTESSDQFRWRKKSVTSTHAVALASP